MEEQNYLVQPEYCAERKADYKEGKKINKLFTPINPSSEKAAKLFEQFHGLCGNFFSDVFFNPKNKKFVFVNEEYDLQKEEVKKMGYVNRYEVISAALFLYRLICLFENPIVITDGANGYKVPWNMYFIHNETGIIMSFGEWKGAVTVHTPHSECENKILNRDILRVLNLVASNKSPHPYDETTAGSVA